MITGIRHTGIVVTDMGKALAFYRDLLGLQVVKDFQEEGDYIDSISGLSGVRLRMVKLTAGDGTMVELLQYFSHPGQARDDALGLSSFTLTGRNERAEARICDIGCSHVAFTVDDIDKEYARLSQNGVRFNCPPYISPDGYAKVTFCHDPDGTSLELVEVLD